MIIGLTGKNAAGKGEAAAYLKNKGFVYYSLSDVIREEATKREIDHSRDNMIALGNELRQKFGSQYLAQQISMKITNQLKNNKKLNFVVDSVRSPFEAKELMKNKNFVLVGIEAPVEIRFKRLLERNRLGDAKTLEEFRQQEERENLKNNTNQQLDKTFGMANRVIVNDDALSDLYKKIDDLLKGLKWQE
jgi:dephospho-CoA kinase